MTVKILLAGVEREVAVADGRQGDGAEVERVQEAPSLDPMVEEGAGEEGQGHQERERLEVGVFHRARHSQNEAHQGDEEGYHRLPTALALVRTEADAEEVEEDLDDGEGGDGEDHAHEPP